MSQGAPWQVQGSNPNQAAAPVQMFDPSKFQGEAATAAPGHSFATPQSGKPAPEQQQQQQPDQQQATGDNWDMGWAQDSWGSQDTGQWFPAQQQGQVPQQGHGQDFGQSQQGSLNNSAENWTAQGQYFNGNGSGNAGYQQPGSDWTQPELFGGQVPSATGVPPQDHQGYYHQPGYNTGQNFASQNAATGVAAAASGQMGVNHNPGFTDQSLQPATEEAGGISVFFGGNDADEVRPAHPEVPNPQGQLQDIPLDQSNKSEAPPTGGDSGNMINSNSFNNLAFQPSPFDEIANSTPQQPQTVGQHLGVPGVTPMFSKPEEHPQNDKVKFIVGGSASSSANPSASPSPAMFELSGAAEPQTVPSATSSQGGKVERPPSVSSRASHQSHSRQSSLLDSQDFRDRPSGTSLDGSSSFDSPHRFQSPGQPPVDRSPSVQSSYSVDSNTSGSLSVSGPPPSITPVGKSSQAGANPFRKGLTSSPRASPSTASTMSQGTPMPPMMVPSQVPAMYNTGAVAGGGGESAYHPGTEPSLGTGQQATPEEAQPSPQVVESPATQTASSTAQQHQLDIYATPIEPKGVSAFHAVTPPAQSPQEQPAAGNSDSQFSFPQSKPVDPTTETQAQPQLLTQASKEEPFRQGPSNLQNSHGDDSSHQPEGFGQQQHDINPASTLPGIQQSLAYQYHQHREQHNMSPATTLWENPEPKIQGMRLAPVPNGQPQGQGHAQGQGQAQGQGPQQGAGPGQSGHSQQEPQGAVGGSAVTTQAHSSEVGGGVQHQSHQYTQGHGEQVVPTGNQGHHPAPQPQAAVITHQPQSPKGSPPKDDFSVGQGQGAIPKTQPLEGFHPPPQQPQHVQNLSHLEGNAATSQHMSQGFHHGIAGTGQGGQYTQPPSNLANATSVAGAGQHHPQPSYVNQQSDAFVSQPLPQNPPASNASSAFASGFEQSITGAGNPHSGSFSVGQGFPRPADGQHGMTTTNNTHSAGQQRHSSDNLTLHQGASSGQTPQEQVAQSPNPLAGMQAQERQQAPVSSIASGQRLPNQAQSSVFSPQSQAQSSVGGGAPGNVQQAATAQSQHGLPLPQPTPAAQPQSPQSQPPGPELSPGAYTRQQPPVHSSLSPSVSTTHAQQPSVLSPVSPGGAPVQTQPGFTHHGNPEVHQQQQHQPPSGQAQQQPQLHVPTQQQQYQQPQAPQPQSPSGPVQNEQPTAQQLTPEATQNTPVSVHNPVTPAQYFASPSNNPVQGVPTPLGPPQAQTQAQPQPSPVIQQQPQPAAQAPSVNTSQGSEPPQAPATNPPQQQTHEPQMPPQPMNHPLTSHSRKESTDSISSEIRMSRQNSRVNEPPHVTEQGSVIDPNKSQNQQDQITDRSYPGTQQQGQRDQRDPRNQPDPRDPRNQPDPRDPRSQPDPRSQDPRGQVDPRDRDPRYPYDPRYDDQRRSGYNYSYNDPRYSHIPQPDPRYDPYYQYRPPSRGGYYEDPYRYGASYDRPRSRQGYPDDPYERPRSRQGEYPDEYQRPRSRQGQQAPDPRADRSGSRPSSRQGYPEESNRPSSRQGQYEDQQRPSSRQGYPEGGHRSSSRQGYEYDPRRSGYDYDPRRDYYGRQGSREGYSYYDYHKYYGRDGYDAYGYQTQDKFSTGYEAEMKYYAQNYSADGSRYPAYNYPEQSGYTQYDQRSVHSVGSRGSTPGPECNSQADHFAQEFHHGSRPSSRQSGYEQSPIYPSHSHSGYPDQQYSSYDQSLYADYSLSRYEQYQQVDKTPQRMTPEKYLIPHVRASFGPGSQLVQVMPHAPKDGQPATLILQDINQYLGYTDHDAEQMKTYPGPLIKNETHKNDVLLFCQQQALRCRESTTIIDKESAELVWRLLELLIKQNGTVVGTDIADLLLDGHEPSTAAYARTGMSIAVTGMELDTLDESSVSTTADRSQINQGQGLEELTDRFRHLLLHGRKKDALEWAMKRNLWGHALFLASKMDPKTHASIMTRFANVAMKMNDPLQTLYQLMSGRQPASVTLVADEKWGDWRPHLAMILSNHTSRPDLDRKSIITLGDTMASKGCLHASHFCYLMAQVEFGLYSKKSSKIVLIGTSHTLPFEEFANNLAIQCTEAYEYALSLGNPQYVLPTLPIYKYLYAIRLADAGMTEEALHYCEVISAALQYYRSLYSSVFVRLVYDLASRLKFSDPQRLQGSEDMGDPYWLTQLQQLVQMFEDGTIQSASGADTPLGFGSTGPSSEGGDGYGQGGHTDGQQAGFTDGSMMPGYGQAEETPQQQQSYQSDQYYQQYDQSQQPLTEGQSQASFQQQQQGSGQGQEDQSQGHTEQAWNTSQQQQDQSQRAMWNQGQSYDGSYLGYAQQDTTDGQMTQADPSHNAEPKVDLAASMNSNFSAGSAGGTLTDGSEGRGDFSPPVKPDAEFDYYKLATKSSSGSSAALGTSKTDFTAQDQDTGRRKQKYPGEESDDDSNIKSNAQAMKQNKQPQKSGGGFFKRVFGFGAKNKSATEMKLPSDKKPTIVWDEAKKKWVNTEGGEDDSQQAAPPPPKDMDLGAPTPNGPVTPMSTPASKSGESAAPPSSNKFSRQRVRGARGQYVDVLGGSSKASTAPSGLFNVLPKSASVPAKLFVPGMLDDDQADADTGGVRQNPGATPAGHPTQQAQHPIDKQPQAVSRQNLIPTETPEENHVSHDSAQPAQAPPTSHAYGNQSGQAPPTSHAYGNQSGQAPPSSGQAPPPSMPVMFNPAQFSQGQNTSQSGPSGPSRGIKYGQRRAYPR